MQNYGKCSRSLHHKMFISFEIITNTSKRRVRNVQKENFCGLLSTQSNNDSTKRFQQIALDALLYFWTSYRNHCGFASLLLPRLHLLIRPFSVPLKNFTAHYHAPLHTSQSLSDNDDGHDTLLRGQGTIEGYLR